MSFFPSLFGHDKHDSAKALKTQIDSVFDNFLSDWPSMSEFKDKGFFNPAIDVSEDKEVFEVQAELPAVDKDNIVLEIQGNHLILSGQKTFNEEDKKDKGFHRIERSYGSFRRVIPLPFEVADKTHVDAAYKNGLLTIRIPKPAESVAPENKVNIKFHD